MIRKNKVILAVVALISVLILSACGSTDAPTAVQKDQDTSSTILSKFLKSQPVPIFDWSQIRQTLIDVETAQAHSIATTSFFFNQGVQEPYFVCPSIGFPVASTTQLTNPQQVIGGSGGK